MASGLLRRRWRGLEDLAPTRRQLTTLAAIVAVLVATGGCGGSTDGTGADGPAGPSASTGSTAAVGGVTATLAAPVPAPALTTTVPAATRPPSTSTSTTTATSLPPPAVEISTGRATDAVLLTFDAGSDVGSTDRILEILAQEQIPAAFGITGQFAEQHPDVVARIVGDGHELMNHSWDHSSMTGFSPRTRPLDERERIEQLESTEAALLEAVGVGGRPYFRAPYGDIDDEMYQLLSQQRFAFHIRWSVDSLGWQGLDPERVVERTLGRLTGGGVVLFHVGSASTDAAALPAIITGIRERGLRFATLAEMAGPPPAWMADGGPPLSG